MGIMREMLWLLPILFVFHDFEEIIFMKVWLSRHRRKLVKNYPKFFKAFSGHFDTMTTASFALGVAEEFVLIVIITFTAHRFNWYNLWIGVFIAFTIHLIIHCIQAIVLRSYVPALITSIICIPICGYIIMRTINLFRLVEIVGYSVMCITIMVINLIIVHKGMVYFDIWLKKYAEGSEQSLENDQ